MKNILLLDDNQPFAAHLAEGLRSDGYEVRVAADGAQASRLCREHGVDLVITDVVMPERDGFDVIQELRHERPDLTIVAISGGLGSVAWDALGVAKLLGADQVLAKPFTLADLQALISELEARRP